MSAPLHSQQLQSLSNGLRVWVAVCVAACVLQWVLQHQRLRIAGRKKHTKVMHHFCVVVLFLYTVNGKRQQPRPSISWHLVHPPHAHPHLTLHTPTQRQALRRGMGIGGSRYNATRGKHCNEATDSRTRRLEVEGDTASRHLNEMTHTRPTLHRGDPHRNKVTDTATMRQTLQRGDRHCSEAIAMATRYYNQKLQRDTATRHCNEGTDAATRGSWQRRPDRKSCGCILQV